MLTGSGGKPQQKRDPQTLVPVTMKMALEASEQNGKLFISGHQVSQVRILVNPLSVQLNETNVTITGEDGTGSMTAKIYTDNSSDAPQIPEGQYSMMVGKIVKGNSGQVTMTAFTSRVVEDPNEVTAHFLDCIHTHLRFTQGPRVAAGGAAAPGREIDRMRARQVALEEPGQLAAGLLADDDGIHLIVEQHAAMIEVGGAHHRPHVIDHDRLRMQNVRISLVDPHAGLQKIRVVRMLNLQRSR